MKPPRYPTPPKVNKVPPIRVPQPREPRDRKIEVPPGKGIVPPSKRGR